jgi:hypothetical protein
MGPRPRPHELHSFDEAGVRMSLIMSQQPAQASAGNTRACEEVERVRHLGDLLRHAPRDSQGHTKPSFRMAWFVENTYLLTIWIALLAVVLSFTTIIMQRNESKRDAYREIGTVVMSEDIHRGRWFLNKMEEIPTDEPTRLLIYRTLGLLNNLAMFVDHHVVPKKWVLDVWHHALQDMRLAADLIRAREEAVTGVRTSVASTLVTILGCRRLPFFAAVLST